MVDILKDGLNLSSYRGYLSKEQEFILIDLKMQVNNLSEEMNYPLHKLLNDFDYLRFLRARKFKIDDTMKMITNYIKWRVENKVDQILVNLHRNFDFLS